MKTNRNVLIASIAVLGLAASFNGCTCTTETQGGGYYEAEPPPPPPPVAETPPPSPGGAEWVWIGGHQRWDGHAYVWVRGSWERRPHANARWEPAHWEARGRGHIWVEGHWN